MATEIVTPTREVEEEEQSDDPDDGVSRIGFARREIDWAIGRLVSLTTASISHGIGGERDP